VTPVPSAQVFTSPDGTREVTVSADGNGSAFLYDIDPNDMSPFSPVFLGNGVTDVQFQTDDQGQLTIEVFFDDGAYNLFDGNGNPAGQSVYSPDGTRRVDITGTSQDAYLYDTSDAPAFDPVYLGSNVAAVQFQTDANGQLVVLTENQDGSTNSFDGNGNPIVSQPAPQPNSVSNLSVGKSLEKSSLFGTLSTGNVAW
jgi:hypothetical protein